MVQRVSCSSLQLNTLLLSYFCTHEKGTQVDEFRNQRQLGVSTVKENFPKSCSELGQLALGTSSQRPSSNLKHWTWQPEPSPPLLPEWGLSLTSCLQFLMDNLGLVICSAEPGLMCKGSQKRGPFQLLCGRQLIFYSVPSSLTSKKGDR